MARVRVAARGGANRGAWRWVALLRAANTGGPTTVRNEDVKRAFESAGFADVMTYGQSGNVVLTASISDRDELTLVIEERLRALLGRVSLSAAGRCTSPIRASLRTADAPLTSRRSSVSGAPPGVCG